MKTRIKTLFAAGLLMVMSLVLSIPALAQTELTLRVNKDFGYNAGSKIRGTFSLNVVGPQDLASVTFFIDEEEIGQAAQAPFEIQINTSNFPAGDHALLARGVRADGSVLESAVRNFRFLSREEEASGMQGILIPLLGVVALVTLGGFAIQMLSARGAHSSPQGAAGVHAYRGGRGAICPRCQLPTPVHMTGLNLGFFTKFDRCENCGKWSLMRVRSARDLEVYARAVETQGQPQIQPESPEEKLRRQMNDSRYTE